MQTTTVDDISVDSARSKEKIVGDYRILSKLGDGSTGEIFKGRHIVSGEIVALKILHAHRLDETSLQRFIQEVDTCSRFDHPRIVKVFEFGIYKDRPLLVMEYVDGATLSSYLKKHGSFPLKKALEIVAHITQALDYAHSRGVVHRDLNPANILINKQGQIKIIDFGIAKVHGKSITVACITLGTMWYIPPEQIDDAKSVDHRADIYAVGSTLYHLLYGKPPFFDTEGINALTLRITEGAATPLGKLMDIPDSVAGLVAKAMSSEREERFQSGRELLQAIKHEQKKVEHLGESS